jgi:hypothetical protein
MCTIYHEWCGITTLLLAVQLPIHCLALITPTPLSTSPHTHPMSCGCFTAIPLYTTWRPNVVVADGEIVVWRELRCTDLHRVWEHTSTCKQFTRTAISGVRRSHTSPFTRLYRTLYLRQYRNTDTHTITARTIQSLLCNRLLLCEGAMSWGMGTLSDGIMNGTVLLMNNWIDPAKALCIGAW